VRILFFGNNLTGWKVAEWLHNQGETIAGVVLHPPDKRNYGDEIIHSTGIDPACIFDGTRLREPEVVEALRALKPDIGFRRCLAISCAGTYSTCCLRAA